MDEQKLKTLCDVLVERLSSGEDPEVLRGQLVRELPADQADRLIADAGARLNAGRGDPKFIRSVEDVRKRREAGGGRQSVVALHAQGVRVTAGVFGGIGGILLLGALTGSLSRGQPDLSALVAGLIFAIPAAALWQSKSLIAAGFLVGVCGLASAGAALFAVTSVRDYGPGPLFIPAIWLALLAVAMRAFLIVRSGRRRIAVAPVVEVFE